MNAVFLQRPIYKYKRQEFPPTGLVSSIMPPANEAAWILEPKSDLKTLDAPYNSPLPDELVIKVCMSIYCKLSIGRMSLERLSDH